MSCGWKGNRGQHPTCRGVMFQATINFDVQYFSPDGKIGNFTTQTDFTSSITFLNDYRPNDGDGGSARLL